MHVCIYVDEVGVRVVVTARVTVRVKVGAWVGMKPEQVRM